MQYRSTNPEGKARGMSASILHTKRGTRLVNNYFLAHCFEFHGYNKQCHVFSPQELYECLLGVTQLTSDRIYSPIINIIVSNRFMLVYTVATCSMYNSYLPVIRVHEMHGRMHPNYWQITILLVVDLCMFIIGLLYDDPTPSHSQQIAYKNFGC